MSAPTRVVETFPSVRIPSECGSLAVEVSLISQLGHGAGDQLAASAMARQRRHETFIDELSEPSAKLAGTDFAKGDVTSLYSFVVGPAGHPFHRHAGHRMFTAISGSGGAQLRFSTASREQVACDPQNFLRALRYVNIPADCMFTVRFGGETWHQFFPLNPGSDHPVFFALSCHTNELGGELSDAEREMVVTNGASIPALTELLPAPVEALMHDAAFNPSNVPTTMLALDAPMGSGRRALCDVARRVFGAVRGHIGRINTPGYVSYAGRDRAVVALTSPAAQSLLRKQFAEKRVHHEDVFLLKLTGVSFRHTSASKVLELVLDGFLQNRARGVTNLMRLRNAMVAPMGLRTSELGCPVSSLLSPDRSNLFASRFPVLDQAVNAADTCAEVILGANDKHLQFRACVGVTIADDHSILVTMGTRVHCTNLFGRFYMSAIDFVHRRYISPTMLRLAVEHAAPQMERSSTPREPLAAWIMGSDTEVSPRIFLVNQ